MLCFRWRIWCSPNHWDPCRSCDFCCVLESCVFAADLAPKAGGGGGWRGNSRGSGESLVCGQSLQYFSRFRLLQPVQKMAKLSRVERNRLARSQSYLSEFEMNRRTEMGSYGKSKGLNRYEQVADVAQYQFPI